MSSNLTAPTLMTTEEIDEYVNKLFLGDKVVLEVTKEGTGYKVLLKPRTVTYLDLDRLWAKTVEATSRYKVGITFSYPDNDNTFGPLGRFGTGCPRTV